MARDVMDLLIRDGRVIRSWIGVEIQEIDQALAKSMDLPSTNGALVVKVVEDSPAESAGLEVGDVIVGLQNDVVKDVPYLRNTISLMRPGTKVELKVIRDAKPITLTAKLVELPDDDQQISYRDRDQGHESQLGFSVETLDRRLEQRYSIDSNEPGVVIVDIDRSSRAYDEGLREGDLILAVNRKPVATKADFSRMTSELKSGDTVLVYVQRQTARIFIAFELE